MITQPIFFEKNRVRRVYTGGKLLGEFLGVEPVDGFLPEEWIASSVRAINRETAGEREGVSKIDGKDVYFDALLEKYPFELLGSSQRMRVLVKILDSAVRLPAQAHPDKAFSRNYFHSEYGKAESWLVLGTRPGAKIYYGFKEGVDPDTFRAAMDESKVDQDAMERLMECFEPKVGDVFFVPARTVHAIGAGCLILEVQEPTDFTIQPEHWCGAYELSEQEMFMGLSEEEAIECFDFGKAPDPRPAIQATWETEAMKIEKLIDASVTDCFVVNRITLGGGVYIPNVKDSYGVYIVTKGRGELKGEGFAREVKKGDFFFMPSCLMNQFSLKGSLEIVECY